MLNCITIMGRLVRDPELRRTGNGIAVASFTVAVERDFGQDGKRETDFIDCVAWRQTGEFVSKFFSKGKMIAVKGRLQIRGYTDKDGNKRKAAEVVADNCYFGESKRDSDDGYGNFGYSDNSDGGYPETLEELRRQGYSSTQPGMQKYGEFGLYDDDDCPF